MLILGQNGMYTFLVSEFMYLKFLGHNVLFS